MVGALVLVATGTSAALSIDGLADVSVDSRGQFSSASSISMSPGHDRSDNRGELSTGGSAQVTAGVDLRRFGSDTIRSRESSLSIGSDKSMSICSWEVSQRSSVLINGYRLIRTVGGNMCIHDQQTKAFSGNPETT